ncbi:hypothetical protein OAS39_07060 [Pirellulales bacterium]|nr:hypothetical protein [Pirellulales bacterium]
MLDAADAEARAIVSQDKKVKEIEGVALSGLSAAGSAAAILDSSFAGQQFAGGREDTKLLPKIAASNDKIAEKTKPPVITS